MRILHTMLRVQDLEKSLNFYLEKLNMKVLERHEFEEQKFTLVYIGYEAIEKEACLELIYNWDGQSYEHGAAYGHMAIEVKDVYQTCSDLEKMGVEITRKPGPMKGSRFVLAFIKDPDGYLIELLQAQ